MHTFFYEITKACLYQTCPGCLTLYQILNYFSAKWHHPALASQSRHSASQFKPNLTTWMFHACSSFHILKLWGILFEMRPPSHISSLLWMFSLKCDCTSLAKRKLKKKRFFITLDKHGICLLVVSVHGVFWVDRLPVFPLLFLTYFYTC